MSYTWKQDNLKSDDTVIFIKTNAGEEALYEW